ncbi:hypothetical protein HYE67_000324 [Fusarium culmorum]|uniref:Uncharacterized protein n=1 Tax=Fusarium culmorum TaxID=5516 RepID=A0A7S8CXD4_FUSCU|nr:hypothetical protein HYE67_000324 [Fusarium culmorum]
MLAIVWSRIPIAVLAFPEATKRRHHGYFSQPDPTPAIDFSHLQHLELGKRQQTSAPDDDLTFSVVISPDSTCGYVSGSAGSGVVCFGDTKCTWEIGELKAILCGTVGHLRCLDRTDALNTDVCNDVCKSNQLNLLCTKTNEPYCGTYFYESSIVDYRCMQSSIKVQNVSFSYDGQKGRAFTTTYITNVFSTGDDTTTPATTPSTSSTDVPEPTSKASAKPNVGAIAGGTIGGIALLGVVVTGIVCLRRKKKRGVSPNEHEPQQPTLPPPVYEAPADTVLYEAPGDVYYPESPVSH